MGWAFPVFIEEFAWWRCGSFWPPLPVVVSRRSQIRATHKAAPGVVTRAVNVLTVRQRSPAACQAFRVGRVSLTKCAPWASVVRPRHSMMAVAQPAEGLAQEGDPELAEGVGAFVLGPRPTADRRAWTINLTQKTAGNAVSCAEAERCATAGCVNCCRWTARPWARAARRAIFVSPVLVGVSPDVDCSLIARKVERAPAGCVGAKRSSTRAGKSVFRISKSRRAAIPVVHAPAFRMDKQRATAAPVASRACRVTLPRMAAAPSCARVVRAVSFNGQRPLLQTGNVRHALREASALPPTPHDAALVPVVLSQEIQAPRPVLQQQCVNLGPLLPLQPRRRPTQCASNAVLAPSAIR
jgi:hypothetical protein